MQRSKKDTGSYRMQNKFYNANSDEDSELEDISHENEINYFFPQEFEMMLYNRQQPTQASERQILQFLQSRNRPLRKVCQPNYCHSKSNFNPQKNYFKMPIQYKIYISEELQSFKQQKETQQICKLVKGKLPNKLCKQYHFQNTCSWQNLCHKNHFFTTGMKKSFERVQFFQHSSSVPLDKTSKLTSRVINNIIFYSMKLKGRVFDCIFSSTDNSLNPIQTKQIPEQYDECTYIGSDQSGIFSAFHNRNTNHFDVFIFQNEDSILQKEIQAITGVVQVTEGYFMVSSLKGRLQFWSSKQQSMEHDVQFSNQVFLSFNNLNEPIQHNFIEKIVLPLATFFFVGTNRSQILILSYSSEGQWQFSVRKVQLPKETNLNILKLKIIQKTFIVSAVSKSKQYILMGEFKEEIHWRIVLQEDRQGNSPFHTFDVCDKTLAIGGTNGVLVYDLSRLPLKDPSGYIWTRSHVKSIVLDKVGSEKGTEAMFMAVMEPKDDSVQKSGHFSIYKF